MRKSFLACCVPVIFLYSCAVLSDSQVQNINAFANTAKNYSSFPGEVVRKSQALHYKNNILEASALPDSTLIIHSLNQAKAEYEKGIAFSEKMDLSLQLIQKYAALLDQLSSHSYTDDLGENTKELCGKLNAAVAVFNDHVQTKIPGSVGSGISQIINIVGNRIIRNKQAKALKKFIPIGDTLIQLTTNNLVDALDTDLKPLIESYKSTFQNDFSVLVFNHPARIDYNTLRLYVNTNSDFTNVELLRQHCINTAEKMASAHKELKENMLRKKKLNELLSETKDFISDVRNLYQILDHFNNA